MKIIPLSLMVSFLACIIEAQRVLKINKNLIEKKRGECVDFRAEHYFALNSSSTFVWKKQHTSTMVQNDRISISGNRRTLRITHLTEADTALYSSEVLTTGGLEVTQYWLVVRGCEVNEKETDLKGCEKACQAVCVKDWHHFNGKCFRYFSSPRTWLNSYYYCQAAFRAKLATIESKEENRFVGSLLKSGHGAWIGLNDRSNEHKFLWNYNRYEKPSLFFWDKSDPKNPEPNNFNGHCNVETCVEMKYSNKKWNDVVCKAHIAYVCQKNSKTDLSRWRCQNGKCYLYVRDTVTWDWAQQRCRSRNATLVTISSSSENSFVGSLIKTNIWIGLNDRVEAGCLSYRPRRSRRGHWERDCSRWLPPYDACSVVNTPRGFLGTRVNPGLYVWNDIGQGQFSKRPSYLNWDIGEPNDRHYDPFQTPQRCKGEDCVQIKSWKDVVSWFDLNCNIELPFICEKSRDPYLSFAAWIAISMGAGLILSIFGGRAYMEYKTRKGRKELKQLIVESGD